ncbi:hypothetical protein HYH02_011058 [Chlamydomonas schloesseri]|uniref:Uncharacterized protein n=1 Tax=Chlamydomonas schloesseri TaxID=2026947 RepID=A0A835T2M5_9CHLO|nr:hypothetical protein HYH02_011058 [Chlamydomonas schloesseri]|eukprot:KAG2437678.1 hypothetical protein HYH02_011058 [Chlamydomonas schloesseri]
MITCTAAGRASSRAIVRQTSTDLARQRSLSGENGANSSTQIFIRLAGSGDKCLAAVPARRQLVGVRGCNTSEPNQAFVLKAATGNDANLYSIASAQQPAYVLDFYVPNNTVGMWDLHGRGGSATAIQTARYPDSPTCVEPAPAGEGQQSDLRLAPCDLSNRQLFFLVAPGDMPGWRMPASPPPAPPPACPQQIPGYTLAAGFDQQGSDIVRSQFDSWSGDTNLLAAAKACDSLCDCVGLNTDGYLKRGSDNLVVDKRAEKDRCWGLYVRKSSAASRTCSPAAISQPGSDAALPDRHLGCVQDGTPRVMNLLARDEALMTRRLCSLLARSAGAGGEWAPAGREQDRVM